MLEKIVHKSGDQMGLILFIHKNAMERGRCLHDAIAHHFTLSDIQFIHSFRQFETTLRALPAYQPSRIVIILIDSKDQLKRLLAMADLINGMRLVLVLPDESKTMRSMALKLYPRFFTTTNRNFDELCDVLKKMMSKK